MHWVVTGREQVLLVSEVMEQAGVRGKKAGDLAIWRRAIGLAPSDEDEGVALAAELREHRRFRPPAAVPVRGDAAALANGVEMLRQWGADTNEPLSATSYARYAAERGWPNRNTVARAFGSWHAAMSAAGLAERSVRPVPLRMTSRKPERVDERRRAVIGAVRRLFDDLGRAPTVAEYLAFRLDQDRSLPANATTYRLFPSGWSSVLRAADDCDQIATAVRSNQA